MDIPFYLLRIFTSLINGISIYVIIILYMHFICINKLNYLLLNWNKYIIWGIFFLIGELLTQIAEFFIYNPLFDAKKSGYLEYVYHKSYNCNICKNRKFNTLIMDEFIIFLVAWYLFKFLFNSGNSKNNLKISIIKFNSYIAKRYNNFRLCEMYFNLHRFYASLSLIFWIILIFSFSNAFLNNDTNLIKNLTIIILSLLLSCFTFKNAIKFREFANILIYYS